MIVRKKSGKRFKTGNKIAVVSGIIQREVMSGTLKGSTLHNSIKEMVTRDFYTFTTEESGYAVPVGQCEEVICQ